ncbi:carbohydrate ABC transporter permease [Haloferax larsenii]|uniref:Carbohydrate ABC transporter membrane protein 1, CUT1 family n=1 Tax=Haloferax larsenii TaxID=302484 RepID=A0A1H7QGS0_HALLR|nr:sugar ABC transporter permease [Haloferax larsenii]SEL47291.1 carbohydrate ABC transporter membrane protein 1, CUT1 family [Haloferax larsenii]
MVRDIRAFDDSRAAAVFLAPTLAVLVLFLYYPSFETFRLSLYETLLLGQQTTFVGLDNFVTLATSPEYHNSLFVSFAFAAVVVAGSLTIALFVAYQLYRVDKWRSIYLVAAIWPYALPPAVAATVLLFLLHPNLGVITHYIEMIPGVEFDWFTNGPLAFGVLAVVAIWKQLGYNIVFLLAALHNVPESLAETSRLDGVGSLTMLREVYVPLISPTLGFLVVMDTIYAFFATFPLVDLMTSGGPNGATNLLIFKLYRDAFEFNSLGLASAESIVLFGIVSILMLAQLKLTGEYAHYGA